MERVLDGVIYESSDDGVSWTVARVVDRKSVTAVVVPDGVVEIGAFAFAGCRALVSVTIPASVVKIAEAAFYACSSLASLVVPESVKKIGPLAWADCHSLASLTLPRDASVGVLAFSGCRSLFSVRSHTGEPIDATKLAEVFVWSCSRIEVAEMKERLVGKLRWA